VVTFHGVLQSRPSNVLNLPDFDASFVDAPNHYSTKCKVLLNLNC
jgi:hypothetical protein